MSFNKIDRSGRRGKFLFFPIIGAAMALGLGAVVMGLWNAILPDLLHASHIKYWQAVGLLVLCRILFGNFGKGGGPGRNAGGMGGRGQAMREKWGNMTPDERAKFKSEWRDRCNSWRGRGGQ